jgi:hypothetical protein
MLGTMPTRLLAVMTATLLLVSPACAGDDTAEPEGPGATTTEPASQAPTQSPDEAPSPTSPPATSPAGLQWPTDDVSMAFSGTVPPVPTVVGLRVGTHPTAGYDRVAVEFDVLPGYEIGYREDIVYDGSGEPVDLPGQAFIQLLFTPAQAHDDEGNSTLESPPVEPVEVGFTALQSYVLNGDFEGYVSIALGLTGETGYRVDHFRNDNGNDVFYIDVAWR